jgi:hypothetical protein
VKADVTTPGSFAQYKSLSKGTPASSKDAVKPLLPGKLPEIKAHDYKVELSEAAKSPSPVSSQASLPSLPAPSAPKLPDLLDLPETVREVGKDKIKDEALARAEKVQVDIKEGSVKKPLVLFIKGLDVFSSPSKSEGGYAGLGRIAESIEGSRLYGWDQKADIIKEIKKIHRDYPVVLVGHSLGGDTAIEIADQLDSLKEGFRPVDLLVTIDAIGISHDIIPQNVKKHLNVFGENSLFLNDGPHVARREEKTDVRNILSPLDHTEIDDDKEVQFEIVDMIRKALESK